MIAHPDGLDEVVRTRVQEQGYSYMRTLITAKGADPRSVWEVFLKYNPDSAKQYTAQKIGITNSYPNLPEPHPAYSQWRIAQGSLQRLVQKFQEKGYKNRNVCFLGCPILGSELVQSGFDKSVILDIDTTTLKAIEGRGSENSQSYDVSEEVPKNLKNKFDVVISDPPWYYNDIKLFIKRSAELAKVYGSIYTTIPGIFTKPNIQERLDFQKWLSDSRLLLSKMGPVIGYETPGFEYMAYQDIPAFTGEQWRGGYSIKLKTLPDSRPEAEISKKINWLEWDINGKRILLREKEGDGEAQLSPLNADGSLILQSVSKRNPLVQNVDVWTSRNAVLHIDSGFREVREVLENLAGGSRVVYSDSRAETADLLRKLVEI